MQTNTKISITKDEIVPTARKMRDEGRLLIMIHGHLDKDSRPVITYDYSLGDHGMFMNTEYDTWKNLNEYFPGRAQKHFEIYSPLLSALLLVSE